MCNPRNPYTYTFSLANFFFHFQTTQQHKTHPKKFTGIFVFFGGYRGYRGYSLVVPRPLGVTQGVTRGYAGGNDKES